MGESSNDLTLLEKGHYRLIGRLVALYWAQDGPRLHFLSLDLYDLMVGQNYGLIGRLVALYLAQDGPGPHFLSLDHYDLMVGQNTQVRDADKLLTEEKNIQ